MEVQQNRFLTGSGGHVWINGRLLTTLKKIEAKVTGTFEEHSFCGDYSTYNQYTGWSGEGTLTTGKVDSTVMKMALDSFKTGIFPEVKIITKLTDKATGKSERTSIEGVIFTEAILAGFEAKALIEEESPFKFSNYNILETI